MPPAVIEIELKGLLLEYASIRLGAGLRHRSGVNHATRDSQ